MNKLDFNIKAGWPASAETWEYMQNMILQAQNAALLGGKNYILSGCVESAGNATDGIIVINGEVLPFVGGPVQTKVIIVDTTVKRAFFGGANNNYYHNRVATFGSGTGEVLWSGFKRSNPDNGVLARLDKVEKMLKPLMSYDVAGVTTYGSWLFWGRPASEIPAGWEPVPDADWKGRVPVVLDPDDPEFNTIGKMGGTKDETLSIDKMPKHGHEVWGDNTGGSGGVPYALNRTGVSIAGAARGNGYLLKNLDNISLIKEVGGDQPHNNLQPYRVVMFIRFIG